MISLKNNFVFIHVPKTGGNSFQLAIAAHSDDDPRSAVAHSFAPAAEGRGARQGDGQHRRAGYR